MLGKGGIYRLKGIHFSWGFNNIRMDSAFTMQAISWWRHSPLAVLSTLNSNLSYSSSKWRGWKRTETWSNVKSEFGSSEIIKKSQKIECGELFSPKLIWYFALVYKWKLLFWINDQVSFFNQLCPKAGELSRQCLLTTSIGEINASRILLITAKCGKLYKMSDLGTKYTLRLSEQCSRFWTLNDFLSIVAAPITLCTSAL